MKIEAAEVPGDIEHLADAEKPRQTLTLQGHRSQGARADPKQCSDGPTSGYVWPVES